jgi:hypothetical protein
VHGVGAWAAWADRWQPLNENRFRMHKSRYESVERYISNHWYNRPDEYNDMPPLYDEAIYKRLVDNGACPARARRGVAAC